MRIAIQLLQRIKKNDFIHFSLFLVYLSFKIKEIQKEKNVNHANSMSLIYIFVGMNLSSN